jgi:hypothetical protein
MDQDHTIKISASNGIKHSAHTIKLESESIQMKFSSSLMAFSVWGLFRRQRQQHNTFFLHGLCLRWSPGQQINAPHEEDVKEEEEAIKLHLN